VGGGDAEKGEKDDGEEPREHEAITTGRPGSGGAGEGGEHTLLTAATGDAIHGDRSDAPIRSGV